MAATEKQRRFFFSLIRFVPFFREVAITDARTRFTGDAFNEHLWQRHRL